MAVDIEAHLSDVSLSLERLRVLYEQYFIGIEKQPPNVARREVEKLLAFLAMQNIGNTAVRFRYQTLLRRWKTYAERWDKVLREIDQGTYSRHLSRVKRRGLNAEDTRVSPLPTSSPSLSPFAGMPSEMTDEEDAVLAALSPMGDGPTASPTVPKPPPTPPGASNKPPNGTSPRPPSPVPGMTDADLRALHQRYVDALRKSGDAREIKFESLVSSLKKQVPEIMKKNGCDEVGFNVALKDGKVVLRATPRKA